MVLSRVSPTALAPVFFENEEIRNPKERLDRKCLEQAQIVRWKFRFLKLDAIKPGETVEAFHIRCLRKRLVHLECEKQQKELYLKIMNGSIYQTEAELSRSCILQALDTIDRIERRIMVTRNDWSELESQIRRASGVLKTVARAITSDFAYAEAIAKSRKEQEALESRLHNARTLDGQLHATNRKLRHSVREMLEERNRYNQRWMYQVKQLHRNRKFLLDVIERATLAFNQGEELCHRIEALKIRQQRESNLRVREMIEIKRQIVETRQVNEFLRTKGYQRPVAPLDSRQTQRRHYFKNEHLETIQTYGSIIKHTKKCLNIEAIELLLFEIEKQQDKNMSLFRYVNGINATIEEAMHIANDLEKDSERLYVVGRNKIYSSARKTKQDANQLQGELRQTTEMMQEATQLRDGLELKLATVEHALSLAGCGRAKIEELMGKASNRSQLTKDGLLKALTAVECRVSEMVQMSASVGGEVAEDSFVDGNYASQQCAECTESQDVNQHDTRIVAPAEYERLLSNVHKMTTTPEMQYRLHTLSQCKLPRSRMLVNKRYQ